jgi:predicted TIM-barrel fold metal-dependent hydrolase
MRSVIDCDVHQNLNSLRELVPYLDPAFREYLERGGYTGFQLPNYPWVHPSGFTMGDAVPSDGGVPGSHYPTLREQLLDGWNVEFAILTGEDILNVSCMPHPQLAAALASAYNRWLVDTWLPRDDRLRGSLVIATQDAAAATAEIAHYADHPGIVQVIVSDGARAGYGNPHYLPIWRAAAEFGLPVAVHAGAGGLGVNPPPTPNGYPDYYFEYHSLAPTSAMRHLVSFISHGVFETLRDLRVVLVELGVAWLPSLLWRLDANWKALRSEVPWVKRSPSEQVCEHVKFTTQPLEQPRQPSDLHAILDMVPGSETMLLFATDYPHWDVDQPRLIERRLPVHFRDRVMSENARELYRLPSPVLAAP